jgi:[Skp1-protein]-hydroxyproline N-acetylglucosaminyltransferase
VEHRIIRINTGNNCKGEEEAPTQIAFIAAGFFFTRAEFLTEVPFDPYLPWCFMGEEIALSLRAWTNGWGIYAPRKNLIAHQYRPGRMGLPKFWENTGRVFGRPGPDFNTQVSLRWRT